MEEIFTVGHSTRTQEEFLRLLRGYGIETVIDIRSIPRSAYNPQFSEEQLGPFLEKSGIPYVQIREVGGMRPQHEESVNTGWRISSLRAYADHMATEEFRTGLAKVMATGSQRKAVLMCGETIPWHCHRALLSDALTVAGWTVKHIFNETKTEEHITTPFLRVREEQIIYPKTDQGSLGL